MLAIATYYCSNTGPSVMNSPYGELSSAKRTVMGWHHHAAFGPICWSLWTHSAGSYTGGATVSGNGTGGEYVTWYTHDLVWAVLILLYLELSGDGHTICILCTHIFFRLTNSWWRHQTGNICRFTGPFVRGHRWIPRIARLVRRNLSGFYMNKW